MKGKTELNDILSYSILKLGDSLNFTVLTLVELAVAIMVTIFLLYLVKKGIYRSKRLDIGKKYSL
ncbi:MAG: hypothetical protein WCQ82_07700, partial [Bacteroidaceae bacterium]